jgi:DUF1680 family protein
MPGRWTRRRFIGTTAAAGTLAAAPARGLAARLLQDGARRGLPSALGARIADQAPWKLQPFPMTQVRLGAGPFKSALEANSRYLHSLPNERLLHTFRLTAGLATTAEPIGGWEAVDCELRGHFAGGHYLSACALTYSSTGDEELKSKADALVAELARCQRNLSGGYLGAYPTELYERLRDGRRVWAPFYTYHKIMAGHLDMYLHCGNQEALEVAERMAKWAGGFLNPLSEEHMARLQRVEHGGMNEVLFNLYAVTGTEQYLVLARRFDHKKIFDPLAERRDELNGNHANTNIPKIVGAIRGYELTGEQRYFDIAEYFWNEVTAQHTYCTGGTSNGEGWHEPGRISTQLGPEAQECCCSYNMMKLSRHLYGLTGNPSFMDYYERLLVNTRLGSQDPDGMVMYFISMAPGLYRTFGTPFDSFLCCTGTGVEEFAKTNDSIYFHDEQGIYVNLFIASELNWKEKELKLVQQTAFPDEDGTTLTLATPKPVRFAIHVRIPYWATSGTAVKVNGKLENIAAKPGTYVTLDRTWNSGDKIEISLPMSLHINPTPDDPSIQAMMYGPMVLAGELGTDGLNNSMRYGPQSPALPEGQKPPKPFAIKGNRQDPTAWVEPVAGKTHAFHTAGQKESTRVVPFYKIFKDRYTVYWKVNT